MKKFLILCVFIYSPLVFALEIIGVQNAQLQDLYLYNGSKLNVYPDQGVLVFVKGQVNKRVKLDINTRGAVYFAPGVRIEDLSAKKPIITLDKYGEGQFEIGFSLLGEKNVSGKYKKSIQYKVDYVE
ncbi:MAG: hypothetical protein ACI965_000018 [Paraglaciecola sp.]|jgi:hypothetical protein